MAKEQGDHGDAEDLAEGLRGHPRGDQRTQGRSNQHGNQYRDGLAHAVQAAAPETPGRYRILEEDSDSIGAVRDCRGESHEDEQRHRQQGPAAGEGVDDPGDEAADREQDPGL
jgi:hypothetical protein